MNCSMCSFHMPDRKVEFSRGDLGVGTKWKDICEPCMNLIALIPDYKYKNMKENAISPRIYHEYKNNETL